MMSKELDRLKRLYESPLLDLVFRAAQCHREFHNPGVIQTSTLINIKSGGCSENCAYCPQSVHNTAKVNVNKLMSLEQVEQSAEEAQKNGASRVCLGAAWREVRNNRDFDRVTEMVQTISSRGMEVCCTLGMLTEEQAIKLKNAGLTAYNHNIDTSEEYYNKIISTRDYQDRINTLKNARRAGISLCSGGIIGMGESVEDRLKMLLTLSELNPAPESVPINLLIPVEGTKLQNQAPIPVWDLIRIIAIARILMPKSNIRLSAGREQISFEGQALCYLAGANSIFIGDQLLTTNNPSLLKDRELFSLLGLKMKSI